MTMIVNSLVREYLPQFLSHYSKLTPDDRHNRFFSSMGPSAIRDWVLSTTERQNSHYFFVQENDVGEFEGLVTLGIHPEKNECDVAISVLPQCRGQGVAQKILREAIKAAKEMKLKTMVFESLITNYNCQRLYTKMGFTCKYDIDQQCLVGYLDLENYQV